MSTCDVCHAEVVELRRGRCWGCYTRWVEARPVGLGARCVTCNEKRRRLLRVVELHGAWRPMCFSCAGQLLHLEPLPTTLAEMRELVSRERRKKDRRIGRRDTRVFAYERRVGQRRSKRDEYAAIDDDMIVEITIEPAREGDGEDFEELTAIRDMVHMLRPVELAG